MDKGTPATTTVAPSGRPANVPVTGSLPSLLMSVNVDPCAGGLAPFTCNVAPFSATAPVTVDETKGVASRLTTSVDPATKLSPAPAVTAPLMTAPGAVTLTAPVAPKLPLIVIALSTVTLPGNVPRTWSVVPGRTTLIAVCRSVPISPVVEPPGTKAYLSNVFAAAIWSSVWPVLAISTWLVVGVSFALLNVLPLMVVFGPRARRESAKRFVVPAKVLPLIVAPLE